MAEKPHLSLEVRDRVGALSLHTGNPGNTLTYESWETFRQALEAIDAAPEVKAVLLEAKGAHFCQGADPHYLYKLQQLSLDENAAESAYMGHVYGMLLRLKKPVVAVVQGEALAEGCTLLCCADVVVAVEDAKMGWPEAQFGAIPALSIFYAQKRLAPSALRKMMLLADIVDADTALALGLVDVVETTLEAAAARGQALALRLANRNAMGSNEFIKKLLADLPAMQGQEGFAFACKMNGHGRFNAEYMRGLQARTFGNSVEW